MNISICSVLSNLRHRPPKGFVRSPARTKRKATQAYMSAPGAWTQQKRGKVEKNFFLKMKLGVDATKPGEVTFSPTPIIFSSWHIGSGLGWLEFPFLKEDCASLLDPSSCHFSVCQFICLSVGAKITRDLNFSGLSTHNLCSCHFSVYFSVCQLGPK